MWTKFWDMNSGGRSKEKWDIIYIEAPEEEAKVIFYNRFGHNPERVTCTCCGPDYTIDVSETLNQASAYHRNCGYSYEKKGYIEGPDETFRKYVPGGEDDRVWWAYLESHPERAYLTLEQYEKSKDILILRETDISPEERKGKVPQQGFVWID